MPYDHAEYFDAVAMADWRRLEPAVLAALEPWRGSAGLAIDLGAGTGLTTAALATVTTGEVLACEPEPALRVGLMTRVIGQDDLTRRVTITPWTCADLTGRDLGPIELLTAINVLAHLDHADRAALFVWAARHLGQSGALLLGPVQGPTAAATMPDEVVFVEQQVGRAGIAARPGRSRVRTGWSPGRCAGRCSRPTRWWPSRSPSMRRWGSIRPSSPNWRPTMAWSHVRPRTTWCSSCAEPGAGKGLLA